MASDLGLKFRIGADNAEAMASFRQLKDELVSLRDSIKTTVSEVKIKITADAAALNQEVQQIKNSIKSQLGQVEVEVKVKADSASIASSAAAIKNQLKTAMGNVDIDLNISANFTAVTTQAATIRNQINTALGSAIAIHLGIDLQHLQSQLVHARTTINNYF